MDGHLFVSILFLCVAFSIGLTLLIARFQFQDCDTSGQSSTFAVSPAISCLPIVSGLLYSMQLTCDSSTGVSTYNQFNSLTSCAGTPAFTFSPIGQQCLNFSQFNGMVSGKVTTCPVPATTTTTTTIAAASSTATTAPRTTPASTPPSGGPCFHETTLITYKTEKSLKMSDFENHAECRIPHKVMSNGV
jgi:hypothetical protein